MSLAVKHGVLPDRTIRGPATEPKTADKEAAKKKRMAHRKTNLEGKVKRLKIVGKLCAWFAELMELSPNTQWSEDQRYDELRAQLYEISSVPDKTNRVKKVEVFRSLSR